MGSIGTWLCLTLAAAGADSTAARGAPPAFHTTGAFFALSVADLEASARWYSEKLGLRVVMNSPRQNGSAVRVLEGGGLTVELVQLDDAVPLGKAAPAVKGELYVHGMFKAGVVVENLEETLATLKARGVPIAIGPFPARDGQRANAIVRDHAGNFIQFFGK